MNRLLRNIYYFLPVQLVLLHFRKYQLLLLFWIILLLVLTGNFAENFGASTLFLAPEYLGKISYVSMFLFGSAMCVYMMMWHITTFIIHSKRIPYMGATRHAFLVYCFNNSLIPLAFFIFYSIKSISFQWHDEHATVGTIILLQAGFYLGFLLIALISFAYFFRVSRDYFKNLLVKIAKPAKIRNIIPYDSLDYEIDIIPAHSYISGQFRIMKSSDTDAYHPRIMNTVLSRHHRNVIFATLFLYILLLLMGVFMNRPLLRVPAGASFLLLFSIVMGVVGAFKYFLRSWETIGWVVFFVILGLMVRYQFFDLRSIAYGLDYRTGAKEPEYNYEALHRLFTPKRFMNDKALEEIRLTKWKTRTGEAQPPLVVITVSGGGSRASYWSFRTLQYIDSLSHGKLFQDAVLITGASGGMIGASYWRCVHDAYQRGEIKDPYDSKYQDNVGKDLLNSIIFSLASVDLVSPFNKISLGGYSYSRDRGYAMEEEMISNTDGMLGKNIGYFRQREADGYVPQVIIAGTIINDGRQLLISNQPVTYLTQPQYTLYNQKPVIDAVDFAALFAAQDPYHMRLTSALRMNATFPYVLPVVRMPSKPRLNIMDAGLRDNFGGELVSRYLFTLRDWIQNNTREVLFLEIRDTRENDVCEITDQSASLGKMLMDPLFVIQNRWEAFQSYANNFYKDYAPSYMGKRFRFITLQYIPRESKRAAALNFHLTQNEKEDINASIYNRENHALIDTLVHLLQ